mgnify:CR=1 FL=1
MMRVKVMVKNNQKTIKSASGDSDADSPLLSGSSGDGTVST